MTTRSTKTRAHARAAPKAREHASNPALHATEEEATFREQLRQAGLKVTQGRLAVLAELGGARTPMSHGEVADKLVGTQLDRVTVWRILVALTEAGLVDRTDLGDHTWRFELRNTATGHDPHPHFMCVACKTVQCLPRDVVRIAPRFGRGVVEVQIKGRCESCV